MLNIPRIRFRQGDQAIPDVKQAQISSPFRGFPRLNDGVCRRCGECVQHCPTHAISLDPLRLDLGRCVFCGDCQALCPRQAIEFTTFFKLSSDRREQLVIASGINESDYEKAAFRARSEIHRLFGRSLKLRQVSAAGCNGCEMELNACSNVNFDMGRFGIDIVASPRHADGILITGPISENMAAALEDAYQNTPEPRVIILAGSCAISGGVFEGSPALNRDFLDRYPIDLFIPGCPVHPLTCVNGILSFLQR